MYLIVRLKNRGVLSYFSFDFYTRSCQCRPFIGNRCGLWRVHRTFYLYGVRTRFCRACLPFLRWLNDFLFDSHVAPIYFISVITALSLKIHAFKSLSSHWNIVLFLYFYLFSLSMNILR